MFRLIGAVLAFVWSWVLAADDSPQDPPKDPPKDPPQDTPEEPADEIVVKFKDDAARQEWLDNQFSVRYKRKQAEIREEVEGTVREQLEGEIKAEKAKEDEDWESYASGLAEQVIARDEKVTKLKTDQETVTQERDALKERVENLEKRVKASVKKRVESVPDSLRPLVNEAIANKTVEEQETWLEKNAASFAAPQDALGSPATPAGSRNNGDKEQDKQVEAQERYRAFQAV